MAWSCLNFLGDDSQPATSWLMVGRARARCMASHWRRQLSQVRLQPSVMHTVLRMILVAQNACRRLPMNSTRRWLVMSTNTLAVVICTEMSLP